MSDPVRATPPDDTPGPSVEPVGGPRSGSEVERQEFTDSRRTPDDLVAEEEAAAAAEAGAIGGTRRPQYPVEGDPAMEPVYEAGGGPAEGFELAEHDLIENATHGDGAGDPLRDAFRAEVESDRSTAVYGEPDEEESTGVVDETGAPDATHDGRVQQTGSDEL
jgi:hypothetical protein